MMTHSILPFEDPRDQIDRKIRPSYQILLSHPYSQSKANLRKHPMKRRRRLNRPFIPLPPTQDTKLSSLSKLLTISPLPLLSQNPLLLPLRSERPFAWICSWVTPIRGTTQMKFWMARSTMESRKDLRSDGVREWMERDGFGFVTILLCHKNDQTTRRESWSE